MSYPLHRPNIQITTTVQFFFS